jgi:hypothetical protein
VVGAKIALVYRGTLPLLKPMVSVKAPTLVAVTFRVVW